MTYSEKLRDPRWQKKRLQILNRDKFKCVYCGDKETELQIHHLKYSGEPWEADNKLLITLCKECHLGIEFVNIPYVKKIIKLRYVGSAGEDIVCLLIKHTLHERQIVDVINLTHNKPKFMISVDCSGMLIKSLIKLCK